MKYKKPEMSVLSLEEQEVITASLEWDEDAGDGTVTMPDV